MPLDEKMQKRLDQWIKTRKLPPPAPTFLGRRGDDYGDDPRDLEKRDNKAWKREQKDNPTIYGAT